MRISTVMAAFNAGPYVAEALDSVLGQTFPPQEVIVVDDGSTDATPEVLRRYADRIHLIRRQNSGPARAFNAGIAEASGDALAFIDADDLWAPEKLEFQCNVLASNDDVEAVFGAIQQFVSPDVDPEIAKRYVVPAGPQPGVAKTTMLIRRLAFDRIGTFDESYKTLDFVDWYARAGAMGLRSIMLTQVVAQRRQHAENLGRRKRSETHDELLEALRRSIRLRRQQQSSKATS
jgi:glycosyltransferase involved in cell wall biosynthesis